MRLFNLEMSQFSHYPTTLVFTAKDHASLKELVDILQPFAEVTVVICFSYNSKTLCISV